MDINAYLDRIHYYGSLEATAATLAGLHEAHLLAVPFENLDIHLGRPIVLQEAALVDKIVAQRRGGFCYELNGAFAALLRGLGFQVTLLSARVANSEGEGFGPEYDHLALRVDLDEPWLVDVGFGDSFRRPLRLQEGIEQQDQDGVFRLERDDEEWVLWRRNDGGAWAAEFVFTLWSRAFSEFEGMCLYHQTSPESPFTRKRVCTRATPDGRITLRDDRLIVTRNGGRQEEPIADETAYRNLLREYFAIEGL